MRFTCYVLFSFLACVAFSQNAEFIDSLEQELRKNGYKSEIYNQMALHYLRFSPQQTLVYAEKALEYATSEEDKFQMAKALWLKARVSMFSYNYEKTIQLADSAKTYYLETEKYTEALNCDVVGGTIKMLRGEYMEALVVYEVCAKRAQELDAKKILGAILKNMGRIYRVRGEHEKAMKNFIEVRDISLETGNNSLLAHAYHFIGLVHQDKQNFELAMENYLKSLPLFEQEQILNQIPYVFISMGSASRDGKNYSESLRYFKQTQSYLNESKDTWGLYELNRNMGLAYLEIEEFDSAWINFQYSLEFSKQINEKSGECQALNYLGEILIMKEEYNDALEYLDKALILNGQIMNNLSKTNILFNIGKCNVYMGNYTRGLNLLKQSLALADSLDVIYEMMVINKEISSTYARLNKYQEALHYFQMYSLMNDSIYREEANRNLVEMEKKYQTETQKQKIGQLNFEKVEQEVKIRKQRSARNIFVLGFFFAVASSFLFYRSYRERKKADQEKEALLKEIHHRVKNNLQIISSLLSIQTDNLDDTRVISAVQESQSRVKAMALIHQLLYQDQDLSQINFETYLSQLVNALSSIFKQEGTSVASEIHAENIRLDIDTAIPLGLIVAELTSNAYKYAFNDNAKGKLSLSVKNTNKTHYQLTIADNGGGLPKEMNSDEAGSMGLRLVNILTSQLDGEFEYTFDKGSVFTVKFNTST